MRSLCSNLVVIIARKIDSQYLVETYIRCLAMKFAKSLARASFAAFLAGLLCACSGRQGSVEPPTGSKTPAPEEIALSPMAALGQKLFSDPSLSASGRMSCATCHVPAAGDAQNNILPSQLGGPNLDRQGLRTTPSIRYLAQNTAFFFDEKGTPTGGFFWDGRAQSLQQQAGGPFLDPAEMANPDKASVIAKLARTAYVADFLAVFGDDSLSDIEGAFDRLTLAIQLFEREEVSLNAYTSKYDAFLRGETALTRQEKRGLRLFNDAKKGNCFACHPSARGSDGAMPAFTDFTYDNLGVPRNPAQVRNADPDFYDLGLCDRATGDLKDRTDLCGAFKVPSLRNVTMRRAYFHNGHFTDLREVIRFYVERDIHPEKWYGRNPDGSVNKFDDLPAAYKANVNTEEVPYDRSPGDSPALNDEEIEDVLAFLRTLNDGWKR